MYTIYGKPNCNYCEQAKLLLKMKGLESNYIDITKDAEAYNYVISTGSRTVPVVVFDGRWIGGFTELKSILS